MVATSNLLQLLKKHPRRHHWNGPAYVITVSSYSLPVPKGILVLEYVHIVQKSLGTIVTYAILGLMAGEKYLFNDGSKFAIEKVLGEGAFGSVYEVKHVDCEGTVHRRALKVIKCLPEKLVKSLEEVEILRAVNGHANIIKLLHAEVMMGVAKFDFTKHLCILMELCSTNLNEILCHLPTTDYDHLKWMEQMSSALQYLHSMGIMHRDLKPDNILLLKHLRGFEVKVADFGLAKNCSEDPEWSKRCYTKSQVGSEAWMAPEVFQGKYNEKTDVFSMGTIWHGMLEHQYEEVESKRHYGAFVYIPGLQSNCTDKLPLGRAMYLLRRDISLGVSSFGNCLSDSLKEITRKLLVYDHNWRPTADEVYKVITRIGEDLERRVDGQPPRIL